jgi:hypothetical protein
MVEAFVLVQMEAAKVNEFLHLMKIVEGTIARASMVAR